MTMLPFVTIIMPVRNERDFIEKSLTAVLAQDYPRDRLEVIVADGMSEDGTREVVLRVSANLESSGPKAKVRLIDNPGRIVPTGLNTAIREALGEVLIRVDGHALIGSDYVRQCVDWLQKTDVDCVGGAVESMGVGYKGKAIAAAMSSRFGVGSSGFRTAGAGAKPVLTDTVPFGAFRRKAFERIGLFNERMVRHQDYEFNYRLRKAGGKILLLPFVRASYYVRSTFLGLWRQHWQYGIWKGRFLGAHPDSLKLRHSVPPLFVLFLAGSCVPALFSSVGLWFLGFILAAYAVFILFALFTLTRQKKLLYAPILPLVFICLHLSYGLGIWLGLLSSKTLRPAKIRHTK